MMSENSWQGSQKITVFALFATEIAITITITNIFNESEILKICYKAGQCQLKQK